mgnify:FL=1
MGWHSKDPARMDMMMTAWAAHCPHGSLPRVLGAEMVAAGFETPNIATHPIINTRFHAEAYSYRLARLMHSYAVNAGVAEKDAAAWFDELARLDAAGRYYFASTRMIFTATRPA